VEPYEFIFVKDDRDPDQDVDLAPEHYFPLVRTDCFPLRGRPIAYRHSGVAQFRLGIGVRFEYSAYVHARKDAAGNVTINGNPRDLLPK
jgi:hypothetical protein